MNEGPVEKLSTNAEAGEKINGLVDACIQRDVDPVVYASEHSINLKDGDIRAAIIDWSHTIKKDDERAFDKYLLLSKIALDTVTCCDDTCKIGKGLLCPRQSILGSFLTAPGLKEKLALLSSEIKTKSGDYHRQRNLIRAMLTRLIKDHSSREDLESISAELPAIEAKFLDDKAGLQELMASEGGQNTSAEDFVINLFKDQRSALSEKMDALGPSSQLRR